MQDLSRVDEIYPDECADESEHRGEIGSCFLAAQGNWWIPPPSPLQKKSDGIL